MFHRLWHYRSIEIRAEADLGYREGTNPTVLSSARAVAAELEGKYGQDELANLSDFKLSMISGKMSALSGIHRHVRH